MHVKMKSSQTLKKVWGCKGAIIRDEEQPVNEMTVWEDTIQRALVICIKLQRLIPARTRHFRLRLIILLVFLGFTRYQSHSIFASNCGFCCHWNRLIIESNTRLNGLEKDSFAHMAKAISNIEWNLAIYQNSFFLFFPSSLPIYHEIPHN